MQKAADCRFLLSYILKKMTRPQEKYEKYIRDAFDVGVILKGINGILETIGGFFLLFLSTAHLTTIANFFMLSRALQGLIGPSKFLGALYLITHGIVKIVLVVSLLRNRLWAYPAAILVFTLFAFYQLYYLLQGYSFWLVALTILDVIVIFLTWHEWKYRVAHHEFPCP